MSARKQVNCATCGKTFSSANRARHSRSCDGSGLGVRRDVLGLECSRCGRTFQNKTALYLHRSRNKECEKLKLAESANVVVLRPWQAQLLRDLKAHDTRKILVVVDEQGGGGKSFMTKHFREVSSVLLVRTSGSSKTFNLGPYLYRMEAHLKRYDIVIVDLPRAAGDAISPQLASLIECAKDGDDFEFNYHWHNYAVSFDKSTPVVLFTNKVISNLNTLFSEDRLSIRFISKSKQEATQNKKSKSNVTTDEEILKLVADAQMYANHCE